METSKLLFEILKQDEKAVLEYFKNVFVSNEKTVIKFGSIDNEEIKLNFFINGQLNNQVIDLESKIKALFNTDSDLSIIHKILIQIKQPSKISFSPYLKISKADEPLLHAFMLTIKYNDQ